MSYFERNLVQINYPQLSGASVTPSRAFPALRCVLVSFEASVAQFV
jgi:hypothetical protein